MNRCLSSALVVAVVLVALAGVMAPWAVGSLGPDGPALGARWQEQLRGDDLEARQRLVLRSLLGKVAMVEELVEGTLTLPVAEARFRALDGQHDEPRPREPLNA